MNNDPNGQTLKDRAAKNLKKQDSQLEIQLNTKEEALLSVMLDDATERDDFSVRSLRSQIAKLQDRRRSIQRRMRKLEAATPQQVEGMIYG